MKQKIRYQTSIVAFISLFLLLGCNTDTKKAEEHGEQYTCPMHPQIIKPEPGSCPICKMDLVPLNQHSVKMEVDSDLADLIQPANKIITSNINTIKVKESSSSLRLNLSGTVTYNTNNTNTVSSRVGGRIEKLYVRYNLQTVKKGQLLMEIYSPELAAAQQEILYLKSKNDLELLEQAKTKLKLLGVSTNQINNILKTGKVNYKIPVYSNYSGYLINPMENINSANTPLELKEGQYVNAGELLFKIINTQEVWAEFFVDAQEGKNLKTGEEIKITKAEKTSTHQIGLIQPFYKDGFNYQMIRVYLNNQNQDFKIGELLSAKIVQKPTKGIWIPKAAIYQLGEKNIVFIKKDNILKPNIVSIAQSSAKAFLINEGLQIADEIASNAAFLIDTESFINTN